MWTEKLYPVCIGISPQKQPLCSQNNLENFRVSQVGDTHPRRDTLSWGHDFQFIIKNLTSKIMLDSREKYFFSHKNYIKKPSRMVQPIFSADLKSAIGIFISLKK